MAFIVIIPARYESSRFPGKPLVDIHGQSMVQHVYERSVASGASKVIVATDDKRIASAVTEFGGEVCMTSTEHQSGTERLAEVIQLNNIDSSKIIVNVQGDEPFIPTENIKQVADNLIRFSDAGMATLSVPIHDTAEALNPNVVKVVTDASGYALYFSRATIPYDRERFLKVWQEGSEVQDVGDFYQRHIGIYAYCAGFVKRYLEMQTSPLEKIESLEQLRVLWHGEKIHVAQAQVAPPPGIDTPADLEAALQQG